MFNIGGRGQMLIAASVAGWIGFGFDLPWGIHMLVALVGGLVGGALWAGIAGLLKARTGRARGDRHDHAQLRRVLPGLLAAAHPRPAAGAGLVNPKTPAMKDTAIFPALLGPQFNLHFGFILVILADRGGLVDPQPLEPRLPVPRRRREPERRARRGHQRAVDVRLRDAHLRCAPRSRRASARCSAPSTTGFTAGIDAGIGFDAITVALLGRSTPWGIFVAGILFGAFKAGGFSMQAAEGVPIEIVLVVQSLIVLFIAAPPLVRTIFRLPDPASADADPPATSTKEVKAK